MIHDAGNSCLIVALAFTLLQSLLPIWGYWRAQPYFLATARPAAIGQCAMLLAAFALLTLAFLNNDFSIAYVAENSHPTLPFVYQLTALWGAHEGSLLLWVLILALWTLAFAYIAPHQRSAHTTTPLTIAILGCISFGFLCFLIFTSNPFALNTARTAGVDLNPLLQDPAFVIHPPLLYLGYIGFAVTFAITVAALIHGQLDQAWARLTRQFALAAWCLLTLGITVGSWWAYRVFGWGGFWFWDPVENVSLLPWLCGIALIHVLRTTERHPRATVWAALLAILTFALSMLGTFLTRSGIFVSAHAFALDPARSVFLLILFTLTLTSALLIYLRRYPHISKHAAVVVPWLSREMGLLLNSGLLVVALCTILLGTLYPIILDVLHLSSISVGAPYFNTVLSPIVLIMMVMMGIVPFCRWQASPAASVRAKLIKQAVLSVVIAVIVLWGVLGQSEWRALVSLSLCLWIILSVRQQLRFQPGMTIAHVGFAVMIIGVSLVTLLSDKREVMMQMGDSVGVGPYQFQLLDIAGIHGSNYRGVRANFAVTKNERSITHLYPEKRIYLIRDLITTKVAIHPGIFRDLYIALGAPLDQDQWSVRVYYKPFVRWIWAGGILMFIGGLCALAHRRSLTRTPFQP